MSAVDADTLLDMMPLARTLGITIDRLDRGEVAGRLAHDESLCTVASALHGGVLVSLADSVAGICAFLNLPPDATTSTIELKVNFFAAVREGHAVAVARPIHLGRTTIVVQTDVFAVLAGDRRRAAQVTQTQAVLFR